MGHKDLPFEVGQVAESRSFIQGFRGAWFRCKIKKISWKKGQMGHDLEYVDFPDEKIEWTKLYQKPINTKEVKSQLMVRPCFPPIYRESEMPDVNTISKVVVIFDDVLKVGDLVDWFTDGCYWSGRIIELLGDEKVKIELPPPPMGEGLSYEAIRNELRPSLDWTPEYGWMVPKLVEKGNDRCCARIVKPFTQVAGAPNLMIQAEGKGRNGIQATTRASLKCNSSSSSHSSASLLQLPDGSEQMVKRPLSTVTFKETQTPETNLELDMEENGIGKTNCSDIVRDVSADMVGTASRNGKYDNSGSSKKIKADGNISLDSMCSDTLEVAVMDLEELVNRVKWIRGLLEFGKPVSNTMQNAWEFLEHRASSTPK